MREDLCAHRCEQAVLELNSAMSQAATEQLRSRLRHAVKLIESVRREVIEIEKARIALCEAGA